MNKTLTCLALVLIAARANSATEFSQDCSEIGDPQQRLACYDAQHEAREKAVDAKLPSYDEAEEVKEPQRTDVQSDMQQAAEPKGAPADTTEPKRTLFGDEVIELTAQVTAVRRGDTQKMVFRLENGEIWMQTEPRLLPIYEGDTVTIENATMGGYFLSSEKGVVTRVQRISLAQE